MASKNLKLSVAERLIDEHPEVLLAAISEAIKVTTDEDKRDALSVLRRDVKALGVEKKA